MKALHRTVEAKEDLHMLHEPAVAYNQHPDVEKNDLYQDNVVFLDSTII